MNILIGVVIVVIIVLISVILIGDGRFLGKEIFKWYYDKMGINMFKKNEKDLWINMYDSLGISPYESIIDVGTATGDLPLTIGTITDRTGNILGLDWSVNMVEEANRKAIKLGIDKKVKFEQFDARKDLSRQFGTYDALFCLGMVEGYKEYKCLLESFSKVVNPNGRMILSLYKTGYRIKKEKYEEVLREFGYRNFKVIKFRKMHDLLIAKKGND